MEANEQQVARIEILEDGPLYVTGPVVVVDHLGNEIPPKKPGRYALCRCGGSQTKPFCDGTHSKIGFRGAEAAVEAAEADKINPVP
jgi:CDGSH-type Zn-finger protein